MAYVIVDTNCLIRDYFLTGATTQTFLRGCQQANISVHVPDVVIDEMIGNYEKEITRLANEYRSVALKLQRLGVFVDSQEIEIKAKTDEYRRHIH